jgi:hypothetical protein
MKLLASLVCSLCLIAAFESSIAGEPTDDLQSKVRVLVTSDSAPPSSFDADEVFCPQGTVAMGGGVDVGDSFNQTVTTSGPTVGNLRMLTIGAGTHGPANGWFGAVTNATATAKPYKLGVVCVPLTGTSTIVVSDTTSGGFGQTSLVCPGDAVALGGGIDVDNVASMNVTSSGPTFGGMPPHSITPGTYGPPGGWWGSARSSTDSNFWVGVVCAQMGGIQSVVVHDTVLAGSNRNVDAACPAGMIAIGGGITATNLFTVQVTASGPAYGSALKGILTQPDGLRPAADGWEADVRNDGGSSQTVAVVAICARWPMVFFQGDDPPIPEE